MLNVAVLGTCRVYDALVSLQSRSNLTVLPRFWGYPHNTKEILQNIQFATGEVRFPQSKHDIYNLPFLNTIYFGGGQRNVKQSIDAADIVFIEISSLKCYSDTKFFLQGNNLAKSMGIHLFDMDKVLFKKEIPEILRDKLEDLKKIDAGLLTAEEVRSDLRKILSYLSDKTVILTSIFTVDDHNAEVFSSRKLLRDIASDCAAEANKNGDKVYFYDPTPLLKEKGMRITDYSHYEDDFIEILSFQYERLILKTSIGRKKFGEKRLRDYVEYLKPRWVLNNGRQMLFRFKEKLLNRTIDKV